MLPPIEDSTLQNNPKFASLHNILQTTILNPNGSTKRHPAQRERDAINDTLKIARVRAAKKHVLLSALKEADVSTREKATKGLPLELLELILLLSAHLSRPIPAETRLLESTTQWANLPAHIPAISKFLSAHLHAQALALARVQSPSTNASYLHRGIPKIVPNFVALKMTNENARMELEKARLGLVGKTTTLLSIYHLATTLCVRILEQGKHGSVARHVKGKTDRLVLRAEELGLEVKDKRERGIKGVYGPEVVEALVNYRGVVRDGVERLGEKEREARRVLWGYGLGRDGDKEKKMKEIARVYGDLQREIRDVGRDVERLRGR